MNIIHCKDLSYITEMLTLIENDISLGHLNDVPIELLYKQISDAILKHTIFFQIDKPMNADVYVLLEKKTFIGYFILTYNGNEFEIYMFSIIKKFQNQGYGKAMLSYLEKAVKVKSRNPILKARCYIPNSNNMIRFLLSNEFKVTPTTATKTISLSKSI